MREGCFSEDSPQPTVAIINTQPAHYPESSLVFFRSTDGGSNWTQMGQDSRDTGTNTVTLSSVQAFSRWTLGSSNAPLPVELTDLTATRDGDVVRLAWRTAAETNNAAFQIQRDQPSRRRGVSKTGSSPQTWTTIGRVEGGGTTSAPQAYRFTDENPPYEAETLTYRLKQVDTDGSTTYSDPINVDRAPVATLQLHPPAPSPVRQRARVRFAVPESASSSTVTLRLYDVMGRCVRTAVRTSEAGRQEMTLDVQSLSSGVYVMQLRTDDAVATQRLTVVH
jgi:hypothetical protein